MSEFLDNIDTLNKIIKDLRDERDAALVKEEEANDELDFLAQSYDNVMVRMDIMTETLRNCREFLRWFTPREDHIGYEARDLVIVIEKLVETKNA